MGIIIEDMQQPVPSPQLQNQHLVLPFKVLKKKKVSDLTCKPR